MEDEEDPLRSNSGVLSKKLPNDEVEVPPPNSLFLALPVVIHDKIFKFLDIRSQGIFARLSSTTLDLAILFSFGKFYQALPQEIRQKIWKGKLISEDYRLFRNLSDVETLDMLYTQTLLLELLKQEHHGLIRVALLRNPSFKTVEERAKHRAMVLFCLNEHDQEEGGWKQTVIFHSLFWEGYKNSAWIDWLKKKNFYLAQFYSGMSESPYSPVQDYSKEQSTRSIVQAIATLQTQMVENLNLVMSYSRWFTALARDLVLLSQANKLEGLLESVSSCISSEGEGRSLLQMHAKKHVQKGNYEFAAFFLETGLLNSQKRTQVCKLARKNNLIALEQVLLDTYTHGLSTYYELLLMKLFTNLARSHNTCFILIWQKQLSFLIGLSEESQASLYYKAQKAYKKKFGKVYTGSFTCPLPVTSDSPFDDDRLGRFYVEGSDTYAEEAERRWGPIAELGDPQVAFELAKTWMTSQEGGVQERALYWFLRYKEFAPDLPFGDFEIFTPVSKIL